MQSPLSKCLITEIEIDTILGMDYNSSDDEDEDYYHDHSIEEGNHHHKESSYCGIKRRNSSSNFMEVKQHTQHTQHTDNKPTTTPTLPSTTMIDFNNSFANSDCVRKVLTGVIVNGFHPQLCHWKEQHSKQMNDICFTNTNTATTILASPSSPSSKRQKTTSTSASMLLIQENITKQVSLVRHQTVHESKWESQSNQTTTNKTSSYSTNVSNIRTTTTPLPSDPQEDNKQTASQIYSDVFEHSDVAQLIAAPGGRIAAWNQTFSTLFTSLVDTKPPLSTLTAFDLVQPQMIPKLYEIFLIALQENLVHNHGNDKQKDDDVEVNYLSFSVPCIGKLGLSNVVESEEKQYYITFSLMNDDDFAKRCFHCIISSKLPQCVGEIFFTHQNDLMKML